MVQKRPFTAIYTLFAKICIKAFARSKLWYKIQLIFRPEWLKLRITKWIVIIRGYLRTFFCKIVTERPILKTKVPGFDLVCTANETPATKHNGIPTKMFDQMNEWPK